MPDGWELKSADICKITGKHLKVASGEFLIRREFYDGLYEHDLVVAPAMPGDLIYVRETFCIVDDREHGDEVWIDYRATPRYSDEHPAGWENAPKSPEALKWKPSIHMSRWVSRTTLKVTCVRVERVQDISKSDAVAEGFQLPPVDGQDFTIGARTNFRHAWQQIYGDHWHNNGWCWVIDFEVIHQNVDDYIKTLEAA